MRVVKLLLLLDESLNLAFYTYISARYLNLLTSTDSIRPSMGRKKVKAAMITEPHETVNNEENGSSKIQLLEDKVDKLVQTVSALTESMKKMPKAQPLSPVSHSSIHSEKDTSAHRLPSFGELRSDGRIQVEVQRRLHQYDRTSRTSNPTKGKAVDVNLKSGRYRAGVYKVYKAINWPHDFCTVLNGKQPVYDDLNIYQWAQGYIFCVLDEQNSQIRENMLKHFTSVLQDAIELSFPAAKRAHGVVLQEIEKGKIDWNQLDQIEKIRSRNAQKVIGNPNPQKMSEFSEKTFICKLFNKGTCKFEKQSEHTDKGVTYQHYCSYCYKALPVKNMTTQKRNVID